MNKIRPYWKAVVGFITPGVVIIAGAITDASDGGSTITNTEWKTALVAMVLTSLGVFVKSNTDPTAQHQNESVQPPHQPGLFD